MCELVVVRHSFTKKGDERGQGSHLSRDGVRAARLVGDQLGAIDKVWVSPAPPVLVAAFPDANVSSWGRPFAHLDAAVLTVVDGAFENVRFVRTLAR